MYLRSPTRHYYLLPDNAHLFIYSVLLNAGPALIKSLLGIPRQQPVETRSIVQLLQHSFPATAIQGAPVGKNAEGRKQQTPNYSRAAVTPANPLKRTEGKVWNLVRYFCRKHLCHKHFSAQLTGLGQLCPERSTVLFQLVEMLAFLPVIDGFNDPMDDDDLPQELVSYFETRYTGGERS